MDSLILGSVFIGSMLYIIQSINVQPVKHTCLIDLFNDAIPSHLLVPRDEDLHSDFIIVDKDHPHASSEASGDAQRFMRHLDNLAQPLIGELDPNNPLFKPEREYPIGDSYYWGDYSEHSPYYVDY